jgi:uncharacterized protein (DUF433 family)
MSSTTRPLPDPLITADPKRLGGTPVFAGTRIPVTILFEYLQDGAPIDEFLTNYPDVTREHVMGILALARKAMLDQLRQTPPAAAE